MTASAYDTLDALNAPDPYGEQLLDRIEAAMLAQPRGLQAHLGPSEFGDPCDRCLTRKLAGIMPRAEAAWLPYIGTAMHAQLADILRGRRGFLVEQRVKVGTIAGYGELEGTFDVYSQAFRGPIDYKVVGIGTLRKVRKGGPSQTYRTQAHGYGRGIARDLGLPVDRVGILYLPRNMPDWKGEAHFWSEPYDEQVVVDALARCEWLLASYREAVGEPFWIATSDAFLASLPAADDCYSCPRYEDAA